MDNLELSGMRFYQYSSTEILTLILVRFLITLRVLIVGNSGCKKELLILPNVFNYLQCAKLKIDTKFAMYNFHLNRQPGLPTMGWIDWPQSGPDRTVAFFGDRSKSPDRMVLRIGTTVWTEK